MDKFFLDFLFQYKLLIRNLVFKFQILSIKIENFINVQNYLDSNL